MSNQEEAPNCQTFGKQALKIIFGLPTEEDFDNLHFYSGGCISMPEQPNWACLDCEIEFV